ncbi:MAG: hypothetical protein EOP19_09700, partial [Hyphomicrobiales bacterium]
MLAFVLRRLFQSLIVMLAVALIAFTMFRFVDLPTSDTTTTTEGATDATTGAATEATGTATGDAGGMSASGEFGTNWPLSVGTTFFTDADSATLRTTEEVTSGWQSLSPEDQTMIRADCATFTTAHSGTGMDASSGASTDASTGTASTDMSTDTATTDTATTDTATGDAAT